MRLVWSKPALGHLDEIFDFILRDNPDAAFSTLETIETAVARLETFPESGRIAKEPDARELVVAGTPYLVLYRIKGDMVQIVAVVHGARRWPPSDT